MTHICASTQTIIGSDNGLSLGRRQAIIWTSAGILLIGTLGTNFSEIRNSNIFIQESGFESVICETAAILSRPQCVNTGNPCLVTQCIYWDGPQFRKGNKISTPLLEIGNSREIAWPLLVANAPFLFHHWPDYIKDAAYLVLSKLLL